jgi:hypothetical protein
LAAGDGFIKLPPEKIIEAIQYGKIVEHRMNAFGGYDLEINKYYLKDNKNYFDLLTPFARIASSSLKMKRSGKELSFEAAQERSRKQVELRVFLYVTREFLDDPIRCVIRTDTDEADISDLVMEFNICDDETDDCVRSLAYLFPEIDLKNKESFLVKLIGNKLGDNTVEIITSRVK